MTDSAISRYSFDCSIEFADEQPPVSDQGFWKHRSHRFDGDQPPSWDWDRGLYGFGNGQLTQQLSQFVREILADQPSLPSKTPAEASGLSGVGRGIKNRSEFYPAGIDAWGHGIFVKHASLIVREILEDQRNLAIQSQNDLAHRIYDRLVVFGDSLSDTGNLFNVLGNPPVVPDPRFVQPPNQGRRISNGNLWIEDLAADPLFAGKPVENFAFIGSTSGHVNVANTTLGTALPPLPGVLDELNLFTATLGNQPADPKGLYFIWSGANDFLTLPHGEFSQEIGAILQGVGNVLQSVETLAGLGAKTIAVANLPNLGRTPFAVSRGLAQEGTAFSLVFDVALSVTLGQLEESLNRQRHLGVDIVQLDTFSLGEAIAANPGKYGFTNITQPSLNNPAVDPATSLFWDDFHPTAKFQQVIANIFEAELSKPTPSTVLQTSLTTASSLLNNSGFRSAFAGLLTAGQQWLASTPWSVPGSSTTIGLGALSPLMSGQHAFSRA